MTFLQINTTNLFKISLLLIFILAVVILPDQFIHAGLPAIIIPSTDPLTQTVSSIDNGIAYVGQIFSFATPFTTTATSTTIRMTYQFHRSSSISTWDQLEVVDIVVPSVQLFSIQGEKHWDLLNSLYTGSRDNQAQGKIAIPSISNTPGAPGFLGVPIRIKLEIPITSLTQDPITKTVIFDWYLISRCDYTIAMNGLVCPQGVNTCHPGTTSTGLSHGLAPINPHCECAPSIDSTFTNQILNYNNTLFGPSCSTTNIRFRKVFSSEPTRSSLHEAGVVAGQITANQLITLDDSNGSRITSSTFGPITIATAPLNTPATTAYLELEPLDFARMDAIDPIQIDSQYQFTVPNLYTKHHQNQIGLNNINPIILNAKVKFYSQPTATSPKLLLSTISLAQLQYLAPSIYSLRKYPIANPLSGSNPICYFTTAPTIPITGCVSATCQAWSLTTTTLQNTSTPILVISLTRTSVTSVTFPSKINISILLTSISSHYVIPIENSPSLDINASHSGTSHTATISIPLGDMRIPEGLWKMQLFIAPQPLPIPSFEYDGCAFQTNLSVSHYADPATSSQLITVPSPYTRSWSFEHRMVLYNWNTVQIPSYKFSPLLPPAFGMTINSLVEPVPLYYKNATMASIQDTTGTSLKYYSPYSFSGSPMPIFFYGFGQDASQTTTFLTKQSIPFVAHSNSCSSLTIGLASNNDYVMGSPWYIRVTGLAQGGMRPISTALTLVTDGNTPSPTDSTFITTTSPYQSDYEQFTVPFASSGFTQQLAAGATAVLWAKISLNNVLCTVSTPITIAVPQCPIGLGGYIVNVSASKITIHIAHADVVTSALTVDFFTWYQNEIEMTTQPTPQVSTFVFDDLNQYSEFTFLLSSPLSENIQLSFTMSYYLPSGQSCSLLSSITPFTACSDRGTYTTPSLLSTGAYSMSTSTVTLTYSNWKTIYSTLAPSLTGQLYNTDSQSTVGQPFMPTPLSADSATYLLTLPIGVFLSPGVNYVIKFTQVWIPLSLSCPGITTFSIDQSTAECPVSVTSSSPVVVDNTAPSVRVDMSPLASGRMVDLISANHVVWTTIPTEAQDSFTVVYTPDTTIIGGSYVLITPRIGSTLNYVGMVKFTGNYPGCAENPISFQVFFQKADRITPIFSINDQRQVSLGWSLSPVRLEQMPSNTTTLYYKFTIHALTSATQFGEYDALPDYKSLYSSSLGLLRGTPIFLTTFNDPTSVQLPTHPNNQANTIAFPETTHTVILTLPSFPQDVFPYGFYILMSPADSPSNKRFDYTNTDTASRYHAIWTFSADFDIASIDSCTSTSCGEDYCNSYTGLCEPYTVPSSPWTISPLYFKGNCQLDKRCPLYFKPNSECTQCICTSEDCLKFTRSIQVNINMNGVDITSDDYAKKKKHTIIENYLRDQLQLNLGGLRTLSSATQYTPASSFKSSVPFPITADNGVVEAQPVGIEVLTVNFMNPSVITGPLHFASVLVTISVIPDSAITISLLPARLAMLVNRLKSIVQVNDAKQFLSPSIHPYLPFPLSFTSNTQFKPFNLGVYIPLNQPTRCLSVDSSTSAICPIASPILLSKSPFWSTCPTTPDATSTQKINPFCTDFNDVQYKPGGQIPQWCTQGWYSYPNTLSVPCTTNNAVPTTLTVTPIESTIDYPAGSTITLSWEWGSQFSSVYTIDIFITRVPGAFKTLLTTVPAAQQSALIKLPSWDVDALAASITLRCTNVATLQSNVMPIRIIGTNLCASAGCGDGTKCNSTTGQCECLPNHDPATSLGSQNTICYPKCRRKCLDDASCTSAAPLTCKKCPFGKSGDLCDIAVVCDNNSISGSSAKCNNHGFLLLPPNTTSSESTCSSSASCSCHDNWGGNDCGVCNLTDAIDTSLRCIPTNTHYNHTKFTSVDGGFDCTKCVCLPGFFGSKCENEAIRGVVTFEKPTSVPFELSSTVSGDIDGMHLITSDCKDVLERDMASSLGIDRKYITITHLEQTTKPGTGPFYISSSATQTAVTYSVAPSSSDGSGLSSLSDLTNTWNSLQSTYNTLPIGVTDASSEVGSPTNVGSAQQPEATVVTPDCPEGQTCDCTPEEKLSNGGVCPITTVDPPAKKAGRSTGIIIGVICGVAAFFIIVVVAFSYARKHQKCCYAPEKKNKRSKSDTGTNDAHLELESAYDPATSTASHYSNASSKAPSNSAGSRTAIDLVEIKDHGEELPDGWSKQKHTVTKEEFYVFIKDGEMKSQKNSPIGGDADGDVENNGW